MPGEHRAVLGLLVLGLVGQVTRLVVADPGTPPGQVRVPGAVGSGAAAARRDSLLARHRPLAAGERIDIDRAPAPDLLRLPGVGPALAQRIVAEREQGGPFGDYAALARVRGVGPGLIGRLAPHLAFSGVVPPTLVQDTTKPKGKRQRRAVSTGVTKAPPGPRPLVLRPTERFLDDPTPQPPATPLVAPADLLNTGTAAELDQLPGIGRVRARRIVAFRDSAGRFQRPEDLARVPGISLALARRLWTVGGAR